MSGRLLLLSRQAFFERTRAWDALVDASRVRSVFLRSPWLRACDEALGPDAPWCCAVYAGPEGWQAAAVVVELGGRWVALGTGASDYLGVPVHPSLDDATADQAVARVLGAILDETGAASLHIPGVVVGTRTLEHLRHGPLFATATRRTVAPTLEASAFDVASRKKSLKRHWNKLHREGEVEIATWTMARDVRPRLGAFMEQHRARWADGGQPTQFDRIEQVRLFECLTERLAESGELRFTTVTLGGELVASHFGMQSGGRLTWYKPTYAPAFAALSPGEVLLRALILRAAAECCSELDFTVGDEAFKLRFATTIRDVIDLQITGRAAVAAQLRLRLGAREWLKAHSPGVAERIRATARWRGAFAKR